MGWGATAHGAVHDRNTTSELAVLASRVVRTDLGGRGQTVSGGRQRQRRAANFRRSACVAVCHFPFSILEKGFPVLQNACLQSSAVASTSLARRGTTSAAADEQQHPVIAGSYLTMFRNVIVLKVSVRPVSACGSLSPCAPTNLILSVPLGPLAARSPASLWRCLQWA